MSTYDHKQILVEYANQRMDVEMAMGHCWQHIDKLYDAQTGANLSHYQLRSKVDTLEKQVAALQATVDRLAAQQPPPKRKRNGSGQASPSRPVATLAINAAAEPRRKA